MGKTTTNNGKKIFSIRRAGLISLTLGLSITTGISSALSAPTTNVANPNQINPTYLEQRPVQAPPVSTLTTPAQPKNEVNPKVKAALEKKQFVLKNVVIEGATVFTPEQLKFSYQDMIGKQVSLIQVQAVATRITDLYHKHDYILSQAIIPGQDIGSGTLKIRVIEGYINHVTVHGDVHENSWRKIAESYGDQLSAIRPVKTSDMERYLLLMNDLPGATAKGVVRPSTAFGAADLDVTMTHKMFDASYTIDNRGTKFVGPWEHTMTADVNSLFGLYDRTLLRIITTSPIHELGFYELQHEEQLDSEGTRLVLDGSISESHPTDALSAADVIGESNFLQAKLVHPFIRSRNENLLGRLIFDVRNSDTDIAGGQVTDDHLRVLRAGGSFDFADDLLGVNLVDAQISQGLSIWDASNRVTQGPGGGGFLESNPNASGVFNKVNLDLTRTQPLPANFSLFTAASGQYAFEALLPAEQFTLGGTGFGQAYDPATLSGDDGLAGKIELRWGQAGQTGPYISSYQFYTYYDVGRVWVRENGAGANDDKSLASLGVGVRANFTENFSGDLQLADPLTHKVPNEGDHGNSPRIFVSATARF